MDGVMKNRRGYTLVEILVVVAVIALMAALTMPAIRAMQAGSARAQAYNTINAALQGVRSYAIMNGVKTAARFQPNGKIFFVYRFEGNANSQAKYFDTAPPPAVTYPNASLTLPNSDGFIYLPVIGQEPLSVPRGYAIADARTENVRRPFFEPFYICYNPDGTVASNEPIWTALTDAVGNPVNINFTGESNKFAWEVGNPTGLGWLEDPAHVDDPADRALARFYTVVTSVGDLPGVVNETLNDDDPDYGPDHYGKATFTIDDNAIGYRNNVDLNVMPTSTTQIALFQTPDDWDKLPLFDTDPAKPTKQRYVDHNTDGILAETAAGVQNKSDSFERVHINPYTGRIIKPIE